jgi:putative endonuclease
MTEPRRERGQKAEALAETTLVRAGYAIVERNWRCALGEIDIVARHGDELVFIEVRMRFDGVEAALESIGRRKQSRLKRLAQEYLNANQLDDVFRIDAVIIGIEKGKRIVEIVENAVDW